MSDRALVLAARIARHTGPGGKALTVAVVVATNQQAHGDMIRITRKICLSTPFF